MGNRIDKDKAILTGIDDAMEAYLSETDSYEASDLAIAILDRLVQLVEEPNGPLEQLVGKMPIAALLGKESRDYRREMEG